MNLVKFFVLLFDFSLSVPMTSVGAFEFLIDLADLVFESTVLLSLDALLLFTGVHNGFFAFVELSQLKVIIEQLLQSPVLILGFVLTVNHALEVVITLEFFSQMLDLFLNSVDFVHRIIQLFLFCPEYFVHRWLDSYFLLCLLFFQLLGFLDEGL